MTCQPVFTVALALCLAVPAGACARAADDLLGVIPEDALGLVVVNRLADTDTKFQELGRRMQLSIPGPLGEIKAAIGVEQGLDEKGRGLLLLMPGQDADAEPIGFLLVPVTDFRQFIEQFQPEDPNARFVNVKVLKAPLLVTKHGGYAVFGERKHRDLLGRILDSSGGTGAELAPLRPWLKQADVAAVIMPGGVKLISAKGRAGLQQFKLALALLGDQGKPAVAIFESYEKILKAAGEEVVTIALGVRIDERGTVHLTSQTRFTPGGEAAKAIGQPKPPEGDLLAGLPPGPFVGLFAGVLTEETNNALVKFSMDFIKSVREMYGLNEKQADELAEEAAKAFKGLRGMSMMLGVGKPGDPLYGSVVVVMHVEDAETYLDTYREYIQVVNKIAKGAESSMLPTTEVKHIEIGGTKALEFVMDIPQSPVAGDVPGYDKLMEKLFGPGGKLKAYMAPAGEHAVVASYTATEPLLRALESVKQSKSPAADEQLAKTAGLLPPGAQWVGYWSPKGTVDFVNRAVPLFMPRKAENVKLPEFPNTPLVGFAAKTSPGVLETYLVVPAPVVKAVGGYIVELRTTERERAAQPTATHEEMTKLTVPAGEKPARIHTFCMAADGNLLCACGGQRMSYSRGPKGLEIKTVSEPAAIKVISPEGELLATWKLEMTPQAINIGPGGEVFVGGQGRLARLDKNGKVIRAADAPQIAELPPLPPEPEEQEAEDKEEDEAAKKAKQAEIEKLREQIKAAAEVLQELQRGVAAAGGDEKAKPAAAAKLEKALAQYQETNQALGELTIDPKVLAVRRRAAAMRKRAVTAVAVTEKDLFVACPAAKGYGSDVWRMDHELGNPEKIVSRLRGCCGQMDIQAKDGELWVAENGRGRVVRYDRHGKLLAAWGRRDRKNLEGFGSCCNPMNIRFGPGGEVYTSEASLGRIKRYSPEGELLGLVGSANIIPGCKHVPIAVSDDGKRVFLLDITRSHIAVLASGDEAPEKTDTQ